VTSKSNQDETVERAGTVLRGGTEVGTFLAAMALPWPPANRRLAGQKFSGCALAIYQTRESRLAVEIYESSSEGLLLVDRAESCPVVCYDDNRIVFTVEWKNRKITSIGINAQFCYSETQDNVIPNHIQLRLKPFIPGAWSDFSTENKAAREKRRHRFAEWERNPDRVEYGRNYAFSSLKGEVLQLRDLVDLVESGKYYHLPGMMSRTGLMLIGKPMGLLQVCAAYQDAPLIIYTSANTEKPPIEDAASFSFSVSIDKNDRAHQNPIDLDVWLRQYGLGGFRLQVQRR
jgi:hypothetical protein